ncbi:hypothetical protein K2Y11_11555 [bacterium]|nr:hypothetical protein [bacterium]
MNRFPQNGGRGDLEFSPTSPADNVRQQVALGDDRRIIQSRRGFCRFS